MQRFQESDNKGKKINLRDALTNLSIAQSTLTLGEDDNAPLLTANDYQKFLTELAQKRHGFVTKNHPFRLLFKAQRGNEQALLTGLANYLHTLPKDTAFPATHLTLAGLGFQVETLKKILSHYTRAGLPAIVIHDDARDSDTDKEAAEYDALVADVIEDRIYDNIIVDLALPSKYRQSTLQNDLDVAYENRRAELNCNQLSGNTAAPLEPKRRNPNSAIRTRQPVNMGALDYDVEMQQQVEVALPAEEPIDQPDIEPPALSKSFLTKAEFVEMVKAGLDDKVFSLEDKLNIPRFNFNAAEQLWNTWTGSVEQLDDASFKLSSSACKALLMHWPQFQFGLDLLNLPAGFKLFKRIIKSKPVYEIDFSPSDQYTDVDHPLKVRTTPAPSIHSITEKAIKTWREQRDQTNEAHQFLAQWSFSVIEPVKYNRDTNQAFGKYFSQLLRLPKPVLQQLLILVQAGDVRTFDTINTFDAPLFEYLLKNYACIEANPEAAKDDLRRLFDLDRKYTELCNYLDAIKQHKVTVKETGLLETLVKHDSQINNKDELLHLIQVLAKDFLNANTDGLLQVYIEYGYRGLYAIYNLVSQHPTAFGTENPATALLLGNMPSLVPLIRERSHYDHALAAISSFNQAKRTWFNTLLTQHCDAQQTDDLPRLVQSFMSFNTAIGVNGDAFTLPAACPLSGIKSMPTALSRCEKLIASSRVDDRLTTWKKIENYEGSELDGNGFVRALRESSENGKEWAFFIPEQNIKLSGLNSKSGVYNTQSSWRSLHKNPPDKNVRRDFFRYVAYQHEDCQLPLDFYTEADRLIQQSELSEQVKSALYALVADATTSQAKIAPAIIGLAPLKDLENIIVLLQQRKDIKLPLTNIVVVSAEAMRIHMLDLILGLRSIPPLPILNKVCLFVANKTPDMATALSNSLLLKSLLDNLTECTTAYDSAVYTGLNEYTNDDFAQGKLFSNFLKAVKLIKVKTQKNLPLSRALVTLVSKFSLENKFSKHEAQLTAILDKINDVKGKDQVRHLCDVLANIALKDPTTDRHIRKPLSIKDFERIISAFCEQAAELKSKNQIFQWLALYVKNHDSLIKYFPADYFDTRQLKNTAEMNHEDKDKLLALFTAEQTKKIIQALLKFNSHEDAAIYSLIVLEMENTAKKLDLNERALFAENIIKLCEQHDTESQALWNLLRINIKLTPHGVEDLNSIMEHASNRVEKQEGNIALLCQKAAIFISDTAPALTAIECSDKPNVHINAINKSDLLSLAAKFILKATDADFNGVYPTEDQPVGRIAFTRSDNKPYQDYADFTQRINQAFDASAIQQPREAGRIDFYSYLKQIEAILAATQTAATLARVNLDETIKLKERLLNLSRDNNSKVDQDRSEAIINFHGALLANKDNEPFKTVLAKHPSLRFHDKYLLLLCDNIQFQQQLAKIDLTDKNAMAAALEQDLIAVSQFVELSKSSQHELTLIQHYRTSFNGTTADLFTKISKICTDNLLSKNAFIKLIETYLGQLKHQEQPVLASVWQFVDKLESLFANITDKNAILSLCVNFNTDEIDYRPSDLINLVDVINETQNNKQRQQFCRIASSLVIAKKYEHREFSNLCTKLTNGHWPKQIIALIDKIYEKPPYPKASELLNWLVGNPSTKVASVKDNEADEAKAAYSDLEPLFGKLATAKYVGPDEIDHIVQTTGKPLTHFIQRESDRFDLCPFDKNAALNGFRLDTNDDNDAYKIINKFTAADPSKLPSKGDCIKLSQFILSYQQMSTKALQENFLAMRAGHAPIDNVQLTALITELLYRATGDEFNTTQYIDLLVQLKNDRVVEGIATGQGKTRIVMATLAGLAAKNKTIDFVTDNLTLATREYVDYQPFFNLLGIETSMIYDKSPITDYKKKGINFSDRSQLNLFRNKAFSEGKHREVLDGVEQDRALVLDEADSLLYDSADTSYKYSADSDPAIKDIQWIYHYLIMYMRPGMTIEDPETRSIHQTNQLYLENVDLCRELFINYVRSIETDTAKVSRLLSLSKEQIELWQQSAVTAWNLKFNENFTIDRSVVPVKTPAGPKHSSEAVVLASNVKSMGSKFSLGVHQCLHARLNYQKANPDSGMSTELKEELAKCYHPFYVPNEKQVIYSSTSKDMLDLYKQGSINAVTGTPGSEIERDEAKEFYHVDFVDAPTHQQSKGKDTRYHFCKPGEKFTHLLTQVQLALENNQPVLIICRNTNESQFVANELRKRIPKEEAVIQEADCQDTPQSLEKKMKAAGNARTITVSTDMSARGVNIKTAEDAKKHGLNVMSYYLAATRDQLQIVGRTKRNGENGESHVFFDASDTEGNEAMPPVPENSEAPAFAREHHELKKQVRYYQTRKDRRKQISRLIKMIDGDLRKAFHDALFKANNEATITDLLTSWGKFQKDLEQVWSETQNKIQAITNVIPLDEDRVMAVNKLLSEYKKSAKDLWSTFTNSAQDKSHAVRLSADIELEVQLSPRAKRLMTTPLPQPEREPDPDPNRDREHVDPPQQIAGIAAAPPLTRWQRLKNWMKENPIKTGIIIGLIVATIAAIAVVSCGAAVPAIGATAAAFGSMICYGATSAVVISSLTMAVGSCVAIAIGFVGSMITGAIIGAFAKFGISRKRKREADGMADDGHDNGHSHDPVEPPRKRSSTAGTLHRLDHANENTKATLIPHTDSKAPTVYQSSTTSGLGQHSLLRAPVIDEREFKSVAQQLVEHREALLIPVTEDNNNNNNVATTPNLTLSLMLGGSPTVAYRQLQAHLSDNNLEGVIDFLCQHNELLPRLKELVDSMRNPALTM